MYDAVVVGAGMFGASFARFMADAGKKVLLVEKRDHLGGMCHTELRDKIIFHKYGPHVFHTNDPMIWAFVKRFANWIPYTTRTKAAARGRLWSFPVNLMTLHQLWGVATPAEAEKKLQEVRVPISDPSNLEDWVLATYGPEIYETFYEGYTKKQWGRDPRTLPAAIARRLPIRTTFEDAYFSDRFEAVPEGGYAPFFERMLSGIQVRLGCDYLDERANLDRLGKVVVYSGRIDEFFGYEDGVLDFRTCRFETEVGDGDFQGNAVINYCDLAAPWTRIVEHKHFYPDGPRAANTLITREYPEECTPGGLPLYPINDVKNVALYRQYASRKTKTLFAGRLGSYRYFDMGEVIAQASKLSGSLM